MSKTFYVFFENDDVDGQKIMQALKKIKGYHHVQDVSGLVGRSDTGLQADVVCTCREVGDGLIQVNPACVKHGDTANR